MAGEADPLAVGDAGRDLDLVVAGAVGPRKSDRPVPTAVGLVDGQDQLSLLIGTPDRAPSGVGAAR